MAEKTELTMADQSGERSEDGNILSGLPSEALAELTPAKTRCILLWISGMYTQTAIAKIIGVSDNTIRAWLYSPEVQAVIQELQKREFAIIDSALKSKRMKAINTMDELMDSPMDAVRFQASKDILDRTGHKAVTEMKIDKTVRTIEEQLKDLAEVTITDAEVIDISDVVEQVKQSGGFTTEKDGSVRMEDKE